MKNYTNIKHKFFFTSHAQIIFSSMNHKSSSSDVINFILVKSNKFVQKFNLSDIFVWTFDVTKISNVSWRQFLWFSMWFLWKRDCVLYNLLSKMCFITLWKKIIIIHYYFFHFHMKIAFVSKYIPRSTQTSSKIVNLFSHEFWKAECLFL